MFPQRQPVSGRGPACRDDSLQLGCGPTINLGGDVMGKQRMKVAKWMDWFNLLERRGKERNKMVMPLLLSSQFFAPKK